MEIINAQEKDNRLHLRYSNVKNYKKCPRMFLLSLTHAGVASPTATKNMAKGNLFEFFVTGESSDPRDINAIIKKNKGRFDGMLKKTVDKIRRMADDVKKHIVEMHYIQFGLSYEKDPRYKFDSHVDFIGIVQFKELNQGKPFLAIADTKWTTNIEEVWNNKSTKDDFLQALIYIWQIYEQTGKLLPFVYIVAQDMNDETIVKPIVINATQDDFKWIMDSYINPILNDKEYKPIVSEYNCLGKRGEAGKCRYFNVCDAGKALLQKPSSFHYNTLNV